MEVMEAIRTRASVRMFKDQPVSDEDMNILLEAVQRCQSWANTQCWEVILVRDQAVKERLRDTLSKGNPAGKGWMGAPVVAVFCAKKGTSGFYKGEVTTDKGDWFLFDMGMAVENFSLVAHSLGLGTVTVGLFDAPAAERILGLPEGYAVVSMNPLGYPDHPLRSPKRKEIPDFVHYDTF